MSLPRLLISQVLLHRDHASIGIVIQFHSGRWQWDRPHDAFGFQLFEILWKATLLDIESLDRLVNRGHINRLHGSLLSLCFCAEVFGRSIGHAPVTTRSL